MTHAKLKSVVAGTLLGGLLLIGTAGLALAKDPGTTPAPSAAAPTVGAGMYTDDMAAMHATMTDQGQCADQQRNEAAPGSQS